jgi:hypothetical protein
VFSIVADVGAMPAVSCAYTKQDADTAKPRIDSVEARSVFLMCEDIKLLSMYKYSIAKGRGKERDIGL